MAQSVSLIGVPMWLGQTHYGVNFGPAALRNAGIIPCLQALSVDVRDTGNIAIAHPKKDAGNRKKVRHSQAIVGACETLAAQVAGVVGQGRFPLILGGDHSISIGSLAGLGMHYNNLGVIWFDAHADINTPDTSPSGNVHGMPLAAGIGIGQASLVEVAGYVRKVKPENIVYIGLRDVDPGEEKLIVRENIRVYTPDDVVRKGMEWVVGDALRYLESRCDGIHLSFDLDGIDPGEIPGVGTPVRRGVSLRDALAGMKCFWLSGKISSADIVELNPLLDCDDRTIRAAVDLISLLIAGQVSPWREEWSNAAVREIAPCWGAHSVRQMEL